MASRQSNSKTETMSCPRRGDIFLVNFDPTIGSEIRKTRPALVIQNDVSNRHSPVTIVAAITSKFEEPAYPTEVILEPSESGLPSRSAVLLNQIRTIDRSRLVKRLGRVTRSTMRRVDHAIQIGLGLIEF